MTTPQWHRGTVRWFDAEKGFGFLDPDEGFGQVFVEYTAITTPGYKTLAAGQRVVFAYELKPRGMEASAVRRE
ncbi:cold shock domain-containing protein [Nocardia panacis]|uniref:Cold shock domain-containing protein n=1 Tax=Nocardia panacis TaxID=2340916 RepID=A0A3A4KEX5_9NOCA|nr:cold shock domain-containing protein [Nocardia panacis]RJO79278.1 cold shock domain-containing protein [Nocardia panacis]